MKRRAFLKATGLASVASSLGSAATPSLSSGPSLAPGKSVEDVDVALLQSTKAQNQNVIFPVGALAVVDVTKPPYNCDRVGQQDCTESLIRALDDILRPTLEAQRSLEKEMTEDPRPDVVHPISMETVKVNGKARVVFPARPAPSKILYFPNGTYLVSDTITYTFPDLRNTSGSELNRQIIVRGQSESGTIIKLRDDCPGFEPEANKPVFSFMQGASSNVAMANLFENISIDTGKGNPGASGLRFFGNNMAAVRHVTIRSGDPARFGSVGVLCDRHNLSGCFFKHVTVDGFDYGIQVLPYRMYTVFEHITLRNQKVTGFLVDEAPLAIRGLKSENQVPALTIVGHPAHVVLIDSELAHQAGSSASDRRARVAAIEHGNGVLFARNVRTTGYVAAVGRFGHPLVRGSSILEYSSHGVFTSSDGRRRRSLDLPIEETPEVPWEDLTQWVGVDEYGARGDGKSDCTMAIQQALNSGKLVVYFQPGRYLINRPLSVPGTVDRINFMFCDLVAGEELRKAKGRGTFRIVGESEKPLVIEDLFAFEEYRGEQYLIEHAARRTVVLSDLHTQVGAVYTNSVSGGKVFIENVCCTDQFPPDPNCYRFHGQTVWARQLNPERANPEVFNDGSCLWVLGFKTEGKGVGFHTRNGGSTEVLGGIINFGGKEDPFVVNDESSTSISCAANGNTTEQNFKKFALERTRGREVILLRDVFPKRILFRGAGAFREQGSYAELYAVPLYVAGSQP